MQPLSKGVQAERESGRVPCNLATFLAPSAARTLWLGVGGREAATGQAHDQRLCCHLGQVIPPTALSLTRPRPPLAIHLVHFHSEGLRPEQHGVGVDHQGRGARCHRLIHSAPYAIILRAPPAWQDSDSPARAERARLHAIDRGALRGPAPQLISITCLAAI